MVRSMAGAEELKTFLLTVDEEREEWSVALCTQLVVYKVLGFHWQVR